MGKLSSVKKTVAMLLPTNEIEIRTLFSRPGIVEDKFLKRTWEVTRNAKYYRITVFGKSFYIPLIDHDRAIAVNMERQEDGNYFFTGNKDLLGTMIDGIMVTEASYFNPSTQDAMNFGLIFLAVGTFLKLVMG